MPIRPIGDRLLVQPLNAATQTSGGLHIPTTAQEKQTRGVVVAVGPGKTDKSGNRVPPDINAGEEVLYEKFAGTELSFHNEDFVILGPEDIIGVLVPDA